jgi:hypothetical protein
MADRRRFKVGELVRHHGKLNPDFGKIGMIARLSAPQKAMRVAIIMCEDSEKVWFVGDFKRIKEAQDES